MSILWQQVDFESNRRRRRISDFQQHFDWRKFAKFVTAVILSALCWAGAIVLIGRIL